MRDVFKGRSTELVLIALYHLGAASKYAIQERLLEHPFLHVLMGAIQKAVLNLYREGLIESDKPPLGGRVAVYNLTKSGLDLALKIDDFYTCKN